MPAVPSGKAVYSGRVELQISGISAGWLGGTVEILRMTKDWQEGTSSNGASWVCANDTHSG